MAGQALLREKIVFKRSCINHYKNIARFKNTNSKTIVNISWRVFRMTCSFINQLKKLRRLSGSSVDNTRTFNDFQKYLHVERMVETKLKSLLQEINQKKDKCLVLLCGSAGDGKSHLISYLKNVDSSQLLKDYITYDDASTSKKPNLTAVDTLDEELQAFCDNNLFNDDKTKIIIAINLGTLNNFIESEKGKNYTALKNYVINHDIFSGEIMPTSYEDESPFQHISFSDYQVFTLKMDGVGTVFLEAVFNKIFQSTEDNPFYQCYKENVHCLHCKRCPVRHNYEFMADKEVQKSVIKKIIEVIVKDKVIVTTRDVLNLIYDILVHPNFDKNLITIGVDDTVFLQNYITWTTPMLLNEFLDISGLLNSTKKYDLLKVRRLLIDEEATRVHTLESIGQMFSSSTEGTPYKSLLELTNISELGAIKPELKKVLYKFMVRLKGLRGVYGKDYSILRFEEFLKYLYYQNNNDEKKLGKLYDSTKKAILNWNGEFADNSICIDDTNEKYWILEQLDFKHSLNQTVAKADEQIDRFIPILKLYFKKAGESDRNRVEINIDYSLYELILDMKEGYRPTIQDKNIHTEFSNVVKKLEELGNKSEKITILPKGYDKILKIVFEYNGFNYEFKVE